jgi:hypothetical protein
MVRREYNFFLVKWKQLWNKGYRLGLGHFAPRPRRYRDRKFFMVLLPGILGIMPDDAGIPTQVTRYMGVGVYLHGLGLGLGLWKNTDNHYYILTYPKCQVLSTTKYYMIPFWGLNSGHGILQWFLDTLSVFPHIEFNVFHWIKCQSSVATTLSKIGNLLGRQYSYVREVMRSLKRSGHHECTILQGAVDICSRH